MKESQDKHKIAIVMAVYNTERYLHEMVSDILAQTMGDFRLFLVDDGSKDGSRKVARRFAEKDPRVVVLEKANSGPGGARNFALDYIHGHNMDFDYIWFCDSDDRVEKTVLEQVVGAMEEYQVPYGLFSVRRVEKNIQTTYPSHFTGTTLMTHQDVVRQYFRYGTKWKKEPCSEAFLNNKIFSFGVVKGYRFREDILRAEDFDFFFQILPKLTSGVLIPEAFYKYRLRKTSLTNSYDKTGDLIICSNLYTKLEGRTDEEKISIQHRLLRAYYLDICQAWNKGDKATFDALMERYSKLKLRYRVLVKDFKVVLFLGPLRSILPYFVWFRRKTKTNRDTSNYYE